MLAPLFLEPVQEVGDLYIDVGEAYAENGKDSVFINKKKLAGFRVGHLKQQVLSLNSLAMLWCKKNYEELQVPYHEIVGAKQLSLSKKKRFFQSPNGKR